MVSSDPRDMMTETVEVCLRSDIGNRKQTIETNHNDKAEGQHVWVHNRQNGQLGQEDCKEESISVGTVNS